MRIHESKTEIRISAICYNIAHNSHAFHRFVQNDDSQVQVQVHSVHTYV